MTDGPIKGLAEIQRKLKKLPIDLAEKVLQSAVTGAAKELVPEAVSRAPRDKGDLADSISARKSKTNSKYSAATGVRPRKGKGLDPYYWWWVELGTELQPPQPFMRPAIHAGEDAAKLKFTKIMASGVAKHAK